MQRRLLWLMIVIAGLGCRSDSQEPRTITLATTTSTRDSGLLDVLLPKFQQQTGIHVKAVAVGSGQAIEMGRRGDADVLLTHAPDAEQQFVQEGFGLQRHLVMYNDFVLVGPAADPALARRESTVAAALANIARTMSPFVSRGDDSGTHMKEQSLWPRADVRPEGDWYLEAGSGMAETLRLASEKGAYTLSDRGTFLAQRGQLKLDIVSQGDPLLRNQYAVILVNPQKHAHVQAEAAQKFIDFLLAPAAQAVIGEFGRDKFGEPLFFPQRTAD